MAMTQAAKAEDFLNPKDIKAFNELYNRLATDVSNEEADAVRALCAKVYSSDSGKKAMENLAKNGVGLSSRLSDNHIAHDDFGKYQPQDAYVGVAQASKLKDESSSSPLFASVAAGLEKRMASVNPFDLTQDCDKMFFFSAAIRTNKFSKELCDYSDKNDVPHLILAENVADIEKRKNSIMAEITIEDHSQNNADRLLLRKYEAARRDPSLTPRYYRALGEYAGKNPKVQDLKKFEELRHPEEMKKSRRQTFADRAALAVRSLFSGSRG